jgi:1-deoxy-D-xylulose-5-phosphate synthase
MQTLNAAGVHTPFRLHGIPQEFLGHAKRAAILGRIGLTPQVIALGIVEDMTSLAEGRSPIDVEQTT